MQELCNVDLTLAALPAPAVADDLQARLAARLAAEESNVTPLRRAATAPPRTRRRAVSIGVAAGFAATAAVALAVLLGLPRDVSEPGVPIARETLPAPELERAPSLPAPDVEPETEIARTPETDALPTPREPERVPEAPFPDEPVAVEEAVVAHAEPVPPAPESAPALPAFDDLPDEDVALALDLDVVEDLDLMANLDLLEALVDLGVAEGA
jgi:hypothetical protein